ncbi:MAG: BA14K family protein, partial [Pseudolabrys sp.]
MKTKIAKVLVGTVAVAALLIGPGTGFGVAKPGGGGGRNFGGGGAHFGGGGRHFSGVHGSSG